MKIDRHFKIKLVIGFFCVLAAVFVFLIYVPPRPAMASFYGIALIVVWYPLTAILYGAAAVLSAFRDYFYIAVMMVLFLCITLLNTVIRDFVEPQAALVYTGMAVASAVLTAVIMAIIKGIMHSWCEYRQKSGRGEN